MTYEFVSIDDAQGKIHVEKLQFDKTRISESLQYVTNKFRCCFVEYSRAECWQSS